MWISLYYIVDIDVIDELIERGRQRRANIDLAIALQVTDYLGPGLDVGHYTPSPGAFSGGKWRAGRACWSLYSLP